MAITPGLVLNDVVSVAFKSQCYGQNIRLNLTYQTVTAPAPGGDLFDQLADILEDIDVGGTNDLVTAYLDCVNEDVNLIELKAQLVAPIRFRPVFRELDLGGNGGVGVTANTAAVLTKQCPESGRKFVGNLHIGPIAVAGSVNGSISGALAAKLSILKDKFLNTIPITGGGTLAPCIWHTQTPGPTIDTTLINDVIAQGTTRTMRRRTVGRGE